MGASYLDRNIDALATDGQLVIIGMQGGVKAELNIGKLLGKRARVIGTTLRGRPVSGPNSKGEIVEAVTTSVWPMIADGRVRPIIGARMPIQQAAEAHKTVGGGQRARKDRADRLIQCATRRKSALFGTKLGLLRLLARSSPTTPAHAPAGRLRPSSSSAPARR